MVLNDREIIGMSEILRLPDRSRPPFGRRAADYHGPEFFCRRGLYATLGACGVGRNLAANAAGPREAFYVYEPRAFGPRAGFVVALGMIGSPYCRGRLHLA